MRDGCVARRECFCLQFGYGVRLHSRGIGEVAGYAARCGNEARVRAEGQQNGAADFSCHGNSLPKRRRLPGTPGNSTSHQSRDARRAGPCRWCNIFRKCNQTRTCRTACTWSVRACEPPRRLYPTARVASRRGLGQRGGSVTRLFLPMCSARAIAVNAWQGCRRRTGRNAP